MQEGDQVPEFELEDADGKVVRSSDFSGRMHVIYFYPRDFTPGCTTEADEFAGNHAEFIKADIDIIGISPDDVGSHRKFCDKMNVRFPLLADTEKKAAKAFGVWGMKKFMGREYMGVMRSTFLVGKDGRIIKVFEKVKPKGHATQVLEAFLK